MDFLWLDVGIQSFVWTPFILVADVLNCVAFSNVKTTEYVPQLCRPLYYTKRDLMLFCYGFWYWWFGPIFLMQGNLFLGPK